MKIRWDWEVQNIFDKAVYVKKNGLTDYHWNIIRKELGKLGYSKIEIKNFLTY